MKKSLNLIIALTIVFISTFVSCKKSSSSGSVQNNLLGTWKATSWAADTNHNGKLDPNEKMDITTSPNWNIDSITFRADGTCVQVGANGLDAHAYTWTLYNNNTDIKFVFTETGPIYGQISYSNINSLTSTNLIFQDTCTSCGGVYSIYWITYTKQ